MLWPLSLVGDVSFRGLGSLETPRVDKGVWGSPHKNDCIGLPLGLSVSLGCVGLLSLGVYLSGGCPL